MKADNADIKTFPPTLTSLENFDTEQYENLEEE